MPCGHAQWGGVRIHIGKGVGCELRDTRSLAITKFGQVHASDIWRGGRGGVGKGMAPGWSATVADECEDEP